MSTMLRNFVTKFEAVFQIEKVKHCGELSIDENDIRKIDKWIKEEAVDDFLVKFLNSPLKGRLIFYFSL